MVTNKKIWQRDLSKSGELSLKFVRIKINQIIMLIYFS